MSLNQGSTQAGKDVVTAVLSPEFWARLTPTEIDKAQQAMERGAQFARERAAGKLRQQHAELRKEAEAVGLEVPRWDSASHRGSAAAPSPPRHPDCR